MKRRDAIQIGDLIQLSIREAGTTDAYDAGQICYLWPEVVGPTINRFTTARWVVRDELHVTIAGGVVKSELAFISQAIIDRLNTLAGKENAPVVRRLVIH